jgi:alpha-methylacyl-CoA racemase
MSHRLPLEGIRVLDFTTLLPGPLATLFLAEAGASVLKIERPTGDPGRNSRTRHNGEPIEFALLNRGKKSIVADLKNDEHKRIVMRLAEEADVLVEQFRPGVMARLGLGYSDLQAANPRLIYCSISGYGQTGPLAQVAGHDLNYVARSGMLGQSIDGDGKPILPQGLFADIGGGTYPAVINILLALQSRTVTGRGCHLDIAMCENTFAWMRNALAPVFVGKSATAPNHHPHTGGSPRYMVYVAQDGVALAVAPIEEPFWQRFCEIIGLPADQRDDRADPEQVRDRVAAQLLERPAAEWMKLFAGEDVCVEIVQDVQAAFDDAHFKARGVFERRLRLHDGHDMPALPVPLDRHLLRSEPASYPALGSIDLDAEDPWAS